MRRTLIALSLLSAFALSGCGVKGTLKTPPPLFGDKNKVSTQTPDNTAPADASTANTGGVDSERELREVLEDLGE